MDYTIEEIYSLAGKDDKTSGISFKIDSEAYKLFGNHIVVEFVYNQKEREELDRKIKKTPFSLTGYIKARYLGDELTQDKKDKLLKEGFLSSDIANLSYYKIPSQNTFHSSEKRTIKKLNIPLRMMPKGGDLDWMYGLKKKFVQQEIGLCPKERQFYLAAKLYYEPDLLTDVESNEMFKDGILSEDVEREYLLIKYQKEESTEEEKKRTNELLLKRRKQLTEKLNQHLQDLGSSLKKLAHEDLETTKNLFIRAYQFHERRLNIVGKIPIYIDLDSYLHIYMRHVEEMKVNNHFEAKDNFQWNEEDVFVVMKKVIQKINDEIQQFLIENPGKRYSRYGQENLYFEGDYYTVHIESDGRISTFYKNRKAHEVK
jgi:hypothetical protein